MLAVFCGRMVRWMLLALLVLKLGPGAVDLVAHHALTALLWCSCLLWEGSFGGGSENGARGAPVL